VSVTLLLDSGGFWPAFVADARTATSRIYVQTLAFEADRAGLGLADLLQSVPDSVDRRLIVDDYPHLVLNDRFLYSPAALLDHELWREARASYELAKTLQSQGIKVRWANPMGWRVNRLAARNHKKILVVDDRVAYIGGINFSDHNFAWHDLMVRIEDRALVECLAQDFLQSFDGRNQALDQTFEDGRLILLDGRTGPALQAPVFEMIAAARTEVFVESPYISAPYFDALEAARRRGTRIVVLTPVSNNWSLFDSYNRVECERRGFHLYYLPRMSHMKSMLIDSRTLIVGSSNFDYFAYHTHQELLFITQDGGLIRDFETLVRDVDLAASVAAADGPSISLRTRLTARLLPLGSPVVAWLSQAF
jgi:cardiolipin synthase